MPEPKAATSGFISTSSTATPAFARWIAVAAPARPLPTTRTLFAAGIPGLLLDGERVDRGPHGAGHGQRSGGEPEVVAAVLGAVGGERVEVPHLADEQADVGDGDLVQRLEGDVELVGPHLEAPGVGRDAGDLAAVEPVGGGERQAGGVAAGVVAPALAAGAGQPAGPHDRQVAAADAGRLALGGDGGLEVLGGDGETVGQLAVGADRPADVEQHPAAGDQPGHGLDAGDRVAEAGDDVAGATAVPGVAVVEDVAEAVPLGGGLQRHGDDVVGAADAVREALHAALGVGAGVEHGVHRVGAAAPPLLRASMSKDWESEKLAP